MCPTRLRTIRKMRRLEFRYSSQASSMICPIRSSLMDRSKRNCRRGRCVSVQLPNYAVTSNKALEQMARTGPLSGCRQRGASVGPNALDHGAEAVRSLRREMFSQAHTLEQLDGVGIQDLPCALAGVN